MLERMVARGKVCVRQLGDGDGTQTKRLRRFLANRKVTLPRLIEGWSEQTRPSASGRHVLRKVTLPRLIEGWSEQTRPSASGRHVLAIQDTSEINFPTRPERRRGLGEIGKGRGRGALLHAMLAVDADSGGCLGLVSGSVTTRSGGRVEIDHAHRALADKESRRWIDTATAAKAVLSEARCVTVVADRESDIYAEWAMLPAATFHLLTRAMHDRCLAGGGTLSSAAAGFAFEGTRTVELSTQATRIKREAVLSLRFGKVQISRPKRSAATALPESLSLSLVEVIECTPPAGVEPVRWRLLTSHDVADAAAAWQIVDWYRQRWIIEQFFRVLKTQGFQIEDSQIASADILLKLIAVAAKAAAITIQLLQARDGRCGSPAATAFDASQIATLAALNAGYEARTKRQKNPHPQASMAWACWIMARLGGWDGYRSSRPPGPITLKNGLDRFQAIAAGWALRDLSTP